MLANNAEHMSITTSLYLHTFFKNEVMTINGVRATDDALIFTVGDIVGMQNGPLNLSRS